MYFVLCALFFVDSPSMRATETITKNLFNPASTFIRSANRIKHELHSIAVFKSRGVFDSVLAGPHRFADSDGKCGEAAGPTASRIPGPCGPGPLAPDATCPNRSASATARLSLRPSTRPWCRRSPDGFRTFLIRRRKSKPRRLRPASVDHQRNETTVLLRRRW